MTATAFPLAHRFRPAVNGDGPLILSAWSKEHRHSPSSRFVRDRDYFADQRAIVLHLLRTSATIVACSPDDEEHVLGFITHGPGPVVHWVYTKNSYRRLGLGDALVRAAFPDRGPHDELYATHAGYYWGQLEPRPDRDTLAHMRARGQQPPAGALTRRRIFYRPYLLLTNLQRAS